MKGARRVQQANAVNEINRVTKAINAEESRMICRILFYYYMAMILTLALFPIFANDFSLLTTLKIVFNLVLWCIFAFSGNPGTTFSTIYVLCGLNIILVDGCKNGIVIILIINLLVSTLKDISLYLIIKYCID